MGAAHAGATGHGGADRRDSAQRRMGIAGFPSGRLAAGDIELSVLGRAAPRGRTRRRSCSTGPDLGCTSAFATRDRSPDLGLSRARGIARRGPSAVVGRAGGATRALPVRRAWRTIVGRAAGAGSVVGLPAGG
jgi:hypothetical protein